MADADPVVLGDHVSGYCKYSLRVNAKPCDLLEDKVKNTMHKFRFKIIFEVTDLFFG